MEFLYFSVWPLGRLPKSGHLVVFKGKFQIFEVIQGVKGCFESDFAIVWSEEDVCRFRNDRNWTLIWDKDFRTE